MSVDPDSSAVLDKLAPDTSKPSEVTALSHCARLVMPPQLHIVSLVCTKYGGGGDGSGGDGGGGGEGGEGGGAGAPGTQMQRYMNEQATVLPVSVFM